VQQISIGVCVNIRYPHASHAGHGYSVLVVALALTFIDTFGAIHRVVTFTRSAKKYTLQGFWKAFVGRQDSEPGSTGPEYIELIGEELDSIEDAKDHRPSYDSHPVHTRDFGHGNTEQWANHVRLNSTMSDGTLVFGPASPHSDTTLHEIHFTSRISLLRRAGQAAFTALEWGLVIAGFGLLLTGIVIYTGMFSPHPECGN
jgi:hypothetical protein